MKEICKLFTVLLKVVAVRNVLTTTTFSVKMLRDQQENVVNHQRYVKRSMSAHTTHLKNQSVLNIGPVHIHSSSVALKSYSCHRTMAQQALSGLGAATNRSLRKAQCAAID